LKANVLISFILSKVHKDEYLYVDFKGTYHTEDIDGVLIIIDKKNKED